MLGYILNEENKDVVIVDANTLASGTTKNTTAKITAQHSLIYNKLLKTIGKRKARLFYNANIMAINNYEEIIKSDNIDCDFEKVDSYVFASEAKEIGKIKEEKKILESLGIEVKEYDSLPIITKAEMMTGKKFEEIYASMIEKMKKNIGMDRKTSK